MLIDVVTEVRVRVGALEGGLKALDKRTDERVETLQMLTPAVSGKDLAVMVNGVNALKEWTGKTHGAVVYDSTVDPFTDDGLFERVKGKSNIALVGFTTEGDVFGGFHSVAVTVQSQQLNDPAVFAFSFESHGRCATPQRFVVKGGQKHQSSVGYWKNNSHGFVLFHCGAGGFTLGNESTNAWCNNMSEAFEGLHNTTLTGKNGIFGPYHHCARLVAIQLM